MTTAQERPGPQVRATSQGRGRKRQESEPEVAVPLRLGQFYVTADQTEALRKIRATGLIDNLDVSASAVVRHALDLLFAQHTPAQLVKLLGSPKGQRQAQRGRPRG